MTKVECLKKIYQALGGEESLSNSITICDVLDRIIEQIPNAIGDSDSSEIEKVGGNNVTVDIRTLDTGLYLLLDGSKYQKNAEGATMQMYGDRFMFIGTYYGSKSALLINTSGYGFVFHAFGSDPKDFSMNGLMFKNNSEVFVPSGDYNPATKKYVDDKIAALRAELGGATNE